MSESLVIRLSEQSDVQPQWIVVDDNGAMIGDAAVGDLDDIAHSAGERRIVALVPSSRVTSRRIDLPVKSRAKIMQALPFALEEQVADDVDKLHFAAGKALSDGSLPVAAVRIEDMDMWTSRFDDHDLEIDAMFADAELLDELPGTAVLLLETDAASMRDEGGRCFSFEPEALESVLDLWLAGETTSDDDEEVTPRPHLQVFCDPESSEMAYDALEHYRERLASLEISVLGDGAIARMALNAGASKAVNLLQGTYAPKSALWQHWPAWRVTTGLAAVAIVFAIGLSAANLYALAQAESELDATLEQAFRATFPDVGEIRDPRAQLDSRLRALAASGGDPGQGFLDGVGALSAAVARAGDAKIETLSYRGGVLDVRVTVSSVDTLDNVTRQIETESTLSASIQSANPGSEGVEGRLQIRAREAGR